MHCLVSKDGIGFQAYEGGAISINAAAKSEEVAIKNVTFKTPPDSAYRYVKIIAKKMGELPQWHLGFKHDGRSWIFIDEITIN